MSTLLRITTLSAMSGWLLAGAPPQSDDARPSPVEFAREVLPILSNKCFTCHGPASTRPKLVRLDSFDGASRDLGGYRAIDPHAPEKSAVLARIHDRDDPMPPTKAEKQLTDAERDVLSRWVREGGRYTKHWAFVPPTKHPPPEHALGGRNEIDAFVGARLEREGIGFAPDAEPATLARRAALVLTGLPPEPERLQAFLADPRPGAYEQLVDELLASPRFGEHQARYWLDAIRYGDTHGLHLDNRRGIFPYRDWVVHALNRGLPLDQFITWQLAGDLLPDPTLEQRVATGFVRMNPSTGEGGAIPAEFQAKNGFDRVETLGTVLLGMSLTCARCHSHKYDPIPQSEYYRLLAFFNSTAESALDGNSYTYEPTLKAPQNLVAWQEWIRIESAKAALIGDAAAKIVAQASLSSDVKERWDGASSDGRLALLAQNEGPFAAFGLAEQARAITARVAAATESFPTTLVAADLPRPRETFLLRRGEYDEPAGDPLEPDVISVLGAFPGDAPRNRLGLARWLVSREQPLVSRVLINQAWQRTFGHGLVRTPEEFGLQGEQPTHPELLDWLAVELQDSGWDLKHMLRRMVTSRAFRQCSARRAGIDDPENRLLARGPSHRLDAEVLRDLALWASGLLDGSPGGEGVKPYQPEGLWFALAHPASNTKDYVRDQGEKLYRRSLYVYWKRTSPHPMMTIFDAPSREASCVQRSRTSSAIQSLALLNETQRVEMARKLAERLLGDATDDRSRLDLLYRLLASRDPGDRERAACEAFLSKLRARFDDAPQDALALLSVGDEPRDAELAPAEVAAWAQIAITVLASDAAILLY